MKLSTNTTVSASAGSNPNKIMFYLGMLFVIIAAFILVVMIGISIATGQVTPAAFGGLFAAIFGGIGGLFAFLGHKGMHGKDGILEEGAAYYGKIFGFDSDYSVLMNGRPMIILVVRYMDQGQIRETRLTTGEIDPSLFPRGATVAFKMLNGQAALVPGSVSMMKLEREEDILNPDFDPTGAASSAGVDCPNCGANITVPYGMSRICPYCSTKVSLSLDGKVTG